MGARRVDLPTTFLFEVTVAHDGQQAVEEEHIRVSGSSVLEASGVGAGGNRLHRDLAEPGRFTLTYSVPMTLWRGAAARAGLAEVPHAKLPPETLSDRNPSRSCASDRLLRFA